MCVHIYFPVNLWVSLDLNIAFLIVCSVSYVLVTNPFPHSQSIQTHQKMYHIHGDITPESSVLLSSPNHCKVVILGMGVGSSLRFSPAPSLNSWIFFILHLCLHMDGDPRNFLVKGIWKINSLRS